MVQYEKKAWNNRNFVYGIDEVGRAPLAGPLVVGCAVLDKFKTSRLIKDSKKLSLKQRLDAHKWLIKNSKFAISMLNHRLIDKHNIYKATIKAMKRAYYQLISSCNIIPEVILVDAMPLKINSSVPRVLYFNQAESLSISVAAASIVAKIKRDDIMVRLNNLVTGYNFNQHKGYGTKLHIEKLLDKKISFVHRKTFTKKIVNNEYK